MSEIQAITTHLRHQQWANEISERLHSGQSIREWCQQHNVTEEAYKYRLRVVRREMLDVVPEEAFAELKEPAAPAYTNAGMPCGSSPSGSISIDINGAVIRFDSSVSEALVYTAVKAVRNA